MSVQLFDINSKNLFPETGEGSEGVAVVPREQVNNNIFIGKDGIIAGDLYLDGNLIVNGRVEMGNGYINYIAALIPAQNLVNFKNYELVSLGNQK